MNSPLVPVWPHEPYIFKTRENVYVLPILHEQLEFSQVVIQAIHRIKPRIIAVELPYSLEKFFLKAVRRLPRISGVRYRDQQNQNVYFLIEPGDPLVEAMRTGLELGTSVHCIDLDLENYPDYYESFPDAYAVHRIGHRAFVEAYLQSNLSRVSNAQDGRREMAMAARLTQLAHNATPVLMVCGMAHAQRVAEMVGENLAVPLDRLYRDQVTLFHLHPESCREVLGTWAYLAKAYEQARANTLASLFPDLATSPVQEPKETSESCKPRVLRLFTAKNSAQPSVLASTLATTNDSAFYLPIDRQKILVKLFREAAQRYHLVTGETTRPYHLRVWLKFLRNWSLLHGRLQPIIYQVILASRSTVDDNFAYEVFHLATHWPWQDEQAEIPCERLTLEDLHRSHQKVRFRPRQVTRRLRAIANRSTQVDPDEWLEGFQNPSSHCSYTPEDIALERFSSYVQKRAQGRLAEENLRVEPFSTSLLDGVNMRETIRNWHEGKLYVQELCKGSGSVGSVVVIFDEQPDKYLWQITWLGEMEEEGDMALYATHPLQQIVGPGICRAEYGGFLLSYPPGRMGDIWQDEFFSPATSRAERLLMAAVDYCEHKLVAYVAKRPPRTEMKSWAARFGKKIVYLPIGQFSPDTLKKLRVFHVLFGKDKRQIAKNYIW